MEINYTAYIPQNQAKEFIDSMYHLESNLEVFQRTVLQDGKIDLVLILNPIYKLGEKEPLFKPGIYVQSNITSASSFELLGNAELIGLRFFPHSFFRVFGIPPTEIIEGIISLSSLYSINEDDLISQICSLKSIQEKLCFVEEWVFHVSQKQSFHLAFEYSLANRLTLLSGNSLDQICSNSSHYKRLQRYFTAIIGASPKQFQRLMRFDLLHQTLKTISPNDVRWNDVIYEVGFYDQSHLNKEVKSMMSLTPSEFLAQAHLFV